MLKDGKQLTQFCKRDFQLLKNNDNQLPVEHCYFSYSSPCLPPPCFHWELGPLFSISNMPWLTSKWNQGRQGPLQTCPVLFPTTCSSLLLNSKGLAANPFEGGRKGEKGWGAVRPWGWASSWPPACLAFRAQFPQIPGAAPPSTIRSWAQAGQEGWVPGSESQQATTLGC